MFRGNIKTLREMFHGSTSLSQEFNLGCNYA